MRNYPGKWITFVFGGTSRSGKTLLWYVHNTENGARIGRVEWSGAWRRYVFVPPVATDVMFEQDCLRDIAKFIEDRTAEHKAARKAAKHEASAEV